MALSASSAAAMVAGPLPRRSRSSQRASPVARPTGREPVDQAARAPRPPLLRPPPAPSRARSARRRCSSRAAAPAAAGRRPTAAPRTKAPASENSSRSTISAATPVGRSAGSQPDQARSLTDAQERKQHADAGGREAPHERRPPAGAGLRRQKQPPRYRRDGGASSVGEEQPEDLAPDLRQLGAQGADSGALDGDPNKADPNNPCRASDNRSGAVAHLT